MLPWETETFNSPDAVIECYPSLELILSLTDWCPVEFDPSMDQQEPGCDAEQHKHVENNVADTPEGKTQQYLQNHV